MMSDRWCMQTKLGWASTIMAAALNFTPCPLLNPCLAATISDYINAGERAYHKGDLAEAEKNFLLALKDAEKSQPDGVRVAEALTDLGVIYDQTERYDEAEAAYKRSLAIREKAYGLSDMSVATTVNDLANLYKDQKKYDQAEKLYKRGIDICLEKEGANSSLLAPCISIWPVY